MPDHGISKRDVSPQTGQTSSLVLGTVNTESSSRTRIHANDRDPKLQDAENAGNIAIKKEEVTRKVLMVSLSFLTSERGF